MGKSKDLAYRGYTGSVETSFEDNCQYGRILFIDDIITYEGSTPAELKKAFEDAVDFYLEHCKETNKQADKPYKGSFNVRVGEELHRQCVQLARQQQLKLNELVCKALKCYVEHGDVSQHHHTHEHKLKVELLKVHSIGEQPAESHWFNLHEIEGTEYVRAH